MRRCFCYDVRRRVTVKCGLHLSVRLFLAKLFFLPSAAKDFGVSDVQPLRKSLPSELYPLLKGRSFFQEQSGLCVTEILLAMP